MTNVSFDMYPNHIKYQTTKKLFWKTYPYKIVLSDRFIAPEWNEFDKRVEYCAQRRAFAYERQTHCPESGWKYTKNVRYHNFFFENELDALNFIKANYIHITTVLRPDNVQQIDALRSKQPTGDKQGVVLRDYLFYPSEEFGGYRYCIDFVQKNSLEQEEELDNEVSRLFNEEVDKSRYYYSYSTAQGRRKLYLNNETDVIYVKMSLNDDIRFYTTAILKSEISDAGCINS